MRRHLPRRSLFVHGVSISVRLCSAAALRLAIQESRVFYGGDSKDSRWQTVPPHSHRPPRHSHHILLLLLMPISVYILLVSV